MNLGKAVTAERKKRGWTQNRLALESMVEARTIHNIERGKANTRILSLYALCEGLGITPAELFKEAEKYEA